LHSGIILSRKRREGNKKEKEVFSEGFYVIDYEEKKFKKVAKFDDK